MIMHLGETFLNNNKVPVFVLEAKRIEPRAGARVHGRLIKGLEDNLP